MAKRTYHTLLSRDLAHPVCNGWVIEFGSWDKADVEAERDDYRDKGWKASELKIIKSGGGRRQIETIVAAMNAKVPA